MKLYWTTEQRKVKDLIPFEYNPRFVTEDRKQKLIRSLEKFNVVEIPAINTDNKLIAGHQRIVVLLELGRGDELIDVRIPNRPLTEQEFKEYNITSNLPTGFWDLDVLDQAFGDIDLKALGLDIDKIEIPEITVEKEEKEEDFEPILPRIPISELGDILEFHSLDKRLVHRIICASSTEQESFEKLLRKEEIRLIVTDPPYNVNYTGGTNEALKIQNDNMSSEQFHEFLLNFYTNCYKYSVFGAPIYVFHADSEGHHFRMALTEAKFKFSQCLIWLKNSSVMGRQDYHWIHEPILYGWKTGSAHYWYSDHSQKTVIEHARPYRNDEHPTMKPVGLIQYLVGNSSKRGDIVFDGFLGSSTTLIACEMTKRNCRGCEIDPAYMDVAVRRWHSYMRDNGLDYRILRNGNEITDEEIRRYYQRTEQIDDER